MVGNNYGPLVGGSLGGASCGSAAQVATPQLPEIEQRIVSLEAHNEEMRSIVAGFGVKLGCVLKPQMLNKAETGCSTPRPVVSPLAERLDKILDDSRHTHSILYDIYDRIAL